ncbi:MAG: hypothetical protein SOZ84_01245 [Treponema sp.]|nr:hypothetical protein [Treponema sp.]
MTMTIPLKISLEDIEAIRYSVKKSKVIPPPEDMQQPLEILKRILETAYTEVNNQQNTLEVFSQALENHREI